MNCFSQVEVGDISDLRNKTSISPSVNVLGYYVAYDGGGGLFTWNPGDTTLDNGGNVIKSNWIADIGRWRRSMPKGEINILWFGAKPDTVTDCRQEIINCRDAAIKTIYENNPNYYSQGTLIIPQGGFRLSDSIEFNGRIRIVGVGNGYGQRIQSQLWLDAGKGGLYFKENGAFGAAFSSVENIAVIGRGTQGRLDKHGIFSSTRIYISNIYCYNLPGDGIRIESRYGGQPDLCVIRNVECYYNQGYGLSFWGYDANQCSVYDLNSHTNGLSNVHDESALGNNYYSTHSAYAGIRQNFVRGYTKNKGKAYYCWNKNINIEPGVNSNWKNFWVEMTTIFFDSTQYSKWSADSTYYDAVPVWAMGPSATNEFFALYTEGGQGAVALSGYSTWWGGTSGTSTVMPYMTFIKTQNSKFNLASGLGFYINSKLDVRDYVGLTTGNGLEIGTDRPGGGRLQINYYAADSAVRFFGNSTGQPGFFLPTVNYKNHSEFGRSLIQAGTFVAGQYGMYLSDLSDGGEGNFKLSKKRLLAMGHGTPTVVKEYAVGDILLDNTGDTTIFAWKCIQKGTPGTWVALKTAN